MGSCCARTLRKRALKNPRADTLAPARGQHSTLGRFAVSIIYCLFSFCCRGRRPRRPVQFCAAIKSPGRTLCAPTTQLPAIFGPRRGQCGKMKKSVKKNAALLHFLGFFSLTHPFGVPRGEQPLGRGPLPRNSGTFFVSFFGHKKGKSCGRSPLKRGGRRRVAAPGHLQPQSKIKQ